MEQLTLWSVEALASLSVSQEKEKDLTELPVLCGSLSDVLMKSGLAGSCGKTCRGHCRARMGRISDASCAPWMNSGMVWRGEYWTHSFSEYPKDADVSFLSDVLETRSVQEKYYLSERACRGILNRANRYGKSLPEEMEEALMNVIHSSSDTQDRSISAVDKERKSKKNVSTTLSTSNNQVIFVKTKNARNDTDYETWKPGNVAPTLNCFDVGETRSKVVCLQGDAKNTYAIDLSPTLTAHAKVMPPMVNDNVRVRRLTPREFERLQGFPDDWTLIDGASDSARYKALGNSMAVPVMKWIGERILKENE